MRWTELLTARPKAAGRFALKKTSRKSCFRRRIQNVPALEDERRVQIISRDLAVSFKSILPCRLSRSWEEEGRFHSSQTNHIPRLSLRCREDSYRPEEHFDMKLCRHRVQGHNHKLIMLSYSGEPHPTLMQPLGERQNSIQLKQHPRGQNAC